MADRVWAGDRLAKLEDHIAAGKLQATQLLAVIEQQPLPLAAYRSALRRPFVAVSDPPSRAGIGR